MSKKAFDRGTVQARAQEIVFNTTEPITVVEACRRALAELYGADPEQLLSVAATLAAATVSGLKRLTHNLPEPGSQLVMDIPSVIGISTPDGDLFVRKDEAEADQVRQWAREGLQHHSTQRLRFKHLINRDLEVAEDVPGNVKWAGEGGMRAIIEERKLKALESGR